MPGAPSPSAMCSSTKSCGGRANAWPPESRKTPMRITALVKSPEHVCCRYRVSAFRPFLEAARHRLELYPCASGWFSGVRLPRDLRRSDAVLVQRKLLSASQICQLRTLAPLLIYDV